MLTDEEFQKVAGPKATRVDFDTARELLEQEPSKRPRIYALWEGQIVKIASVEKLIQYWPTQALWVSGTTISDLIQKAN